MTPPTTVELKIARAEPGEAIVDRACVGASMVETKENRLELVELRKNIGERLARRAGGRVRELEITVIEKRVIISGWVASYYLKQLVLEAVLVVVGPPGGVEFNVHVTASSLRHPG